MSIKDYLVLPKGAKKSKKIRGKGQGSGHGKTSCRGHKGQQARGNTKRYKGFEGGQMPLIRRLPKRGFVNKFKKEYQIVNISSINRLRNVESVTIDVLRNKKLIKKSAVSVKILGTGKISKKLDVHAHAFSKTAKQAIEEAGGKVVLIRKKPKKTQALRQESK
jgi:large subunit ribosomal protein L15